MKIREKGDKRKEQKDGKEHSRGKEDKRTGKKDCK